MLVARWSFKQPFLAGFLTSMFLYVLFPRCESQTPPTDIYDCDLNASSPFTFVVQIWDNIKNRIRDRKFVKKDGESYFNFGILINNKTVLSAAWSFRVAMDRKDWDRVKYARYVAVGQNIWDVRDPKGYKHPCFQSRKVVGIELHPKAKEKGSRLLYDFSLVTLIDPFRMSSSLSPFPMFTIDALELLENIRYVNVGGPKAICTLPVPDPASKGVPGPGWTLNNRIDVNSYPFKSLCVEKNLCQQSQDVWRKNWKLRPGVVPGDYQKGAYRTQQCSNRYNDLVVNGTLLCMVPRWTLLGIEMDNPTVPSSYAGVPLVCNGSILGIVSQVKKGYFLQAERDQDFFVIVTLLRVLRWLLAKIQRKSPTINFDGDTQIGYRSYPTPSRAQTPDWGHGDFLQLLDDQYQFAIELAPKGESAGFALTPCFWKTMTFVHVLQLIIHVRFHQILVTHDDLDFFLRLL